MHNPETGMRRESQRLFLLLLALNQYSVWLSLSSVGVLKTPVHPSIHPVNVTFVCSARNLLHTDSVLYATTARSVVRTGSGGGDDDDDDDN